LTNRLILFMHTVAAQEIRAHFRSLARGGFAGVRKLDDLVKAAGITANQAVTHPDLAEPKRG
jgi:hypothetical protein